MTRAGPATSAAGASLGQLSETEQLSLRRWRPYPRPLERVLEPDRESMHRLLVVDDENDIRELIELTLRRKGYDVTGTGDPRAALALASEANFDAALLDWSMPEMDGGELCARLRELPSMRDTPILIVTAYADTATRDRASAAGATAFLPKPFSLKRLAEVVADLLEPGA